MLQQIYIINQNLKMDKGKIAVQTAHGATKYMSTIYSLYMEKQLFGDIQETKNMNEEHSEHMLKNYREWIKNGMMKKIVFKATKNEIEKILSILQKNGIWFAKVHDFGFTQLPENSFTCIVTEPLTEEHHKKLFVHLKLL